MLEGSVINSFVVDHFMLQKASEEGFSVVVFLNGSMSQPPMCDIINRTYQLPIHIGF